MEMSDTTAQKGVKPVNDQYDEIKTLLTKKEKEPRENVRTQM